MRLNKIDKKLIFLSFFMIIVFSCAFSAVSASDMVDNSTVSTDNLDVEIVSQEKGHEDVLKADPGTFKDLNTSVDQTSEMGILSLERDYTYSDSDNLTEGIIINKEITIDGKGHTLSASNKATILRIANSSHVILKNIIFTNANGTDGGAIHIETGSSVEIRNCTFKDNFASNNGGAIFIDHDSLTSVSVIYDTIFTNNVALKNGGAIFDNSSTLNITSSQFINNHANSSGGAIFDGGVAHITQTTFDGDTAGDDGGAI